MGASECRGSQRYQARVSMRVQLVDSPEVSQQIAESINISTGGVFFASALPVSVGTLVEIFLEVPNEIAAESPSEWRCKGQVVHVRPYSLPFRLLGVGIQFNSRELLGVAEIVASRYAG
jgi:Tfp pilus assembly protein PilZ